MLKGSVLYGFTQEHSHRGVTLTKVITESQKHKNKKGTS